MHFAIDTETNSLNHAYPIEIAAVKIDDFSVSFCERIRTDSKIDARAESVHGISQDDLRECRNEYDVMKSFVRFLETNSPKTPIVLVAHNANFDKRVIMNALERCNLILPAMTTWECTMEMNRKKKFKHCTLRDCCNRAGIEYIDAHSALPDAIMCARVYKDFFKPNKESMLLDEGLAQVNQEECEENNDRIESLPVIGINNEDSAYDDSAYDYFYDYTYSYNYEYIYTAAVTL